MIRLILFSLFFTFPLIGALPSDITVDLIDPVLSKGVLKTEQGGILQADQIRIQAEKINVDTESRIVQAEGCLMVEYGPYLFTGERLTFNLKEKCGTLINGKSAVPPWHFGGKVIHFLPHGEVKVESGFLTSNDRAKTEWRFAVSSMHLDPNHNLSASNVQFQLFRLPFFWVPYMKTNLDWIQESPIRWRMRWGGEEKFLFGMIYQFLSTPYLKSSARLDYRGKRGPGGGFETLWNSNNGCGTFHTINYLARDSSLGNPNQRTRYRFQGLFKDHFHHGKTSVTFSYDKLSDMDMPSDYYDKGLDLKTGMRTLLNVRRQHENRWIANFDTRVRINDFQTVKQELPSLSLSTHPYSLGCTGIIAEQKLRAAYLDFRYANDAGMVNDYSSSRLELSHNMYRPVCLGPFVVTPEVGGTAILYNDSPQGTAKWLSFLTAGTTANVQFVKNYACMRHTIEPYVGYEHITTPSIPLGSHFIFDRDDAWHRLNALRFGTRNLLYRTGPCGSKRILTLDTYAYSFLDTETVDQSIPKLYNRLIWDITPKIRHKLTAAWDLRGNHLDHYNSRLDWSVTPSLAFSTEYRHRDATSWRKVDPDNFLLESARTDAILAASTISDRRDTLLGRLFYRFQSNLAGEFQIRHGWNRLTEPDYTEYQAILHTRLSAIWDLRLSYQKREDDHRFTFHLSLAKLPKIRWDPCY